MYKSIIYNTDIAKKQKVKQKTSKNSEVYTYKYAYKLNEIVYC